MQYLTKSDILKWTRVIMDPGKMIIPDIQSNWKEYGKRLIFDTAESLFDDACRTGILTGSVSDFKQLTPGERKRWYDYVSLIPGKLETLHLFLRPIKDFCRTCIITDEEIEKISLPDQSFWFNHNENNNPVSKRFIKELNYLIPSQIRKAGFEIVRTEEVSGIDPVLIRKIARAIHSRYLEEVRDSSGLQESAYTSGFDDLPDDIKYSNKDNAYHISSKLLAIGYRIRPVSKGFKAGVLQLDNEEIETMSRVEHLRWSWDKRLSGWIYGNVKDTAKKTHPGLVPYDDLPESEKDKDRQLVRLIPAILQDIEYVAYPVDPGKLKDLSYAIKPGSSIHKLLSEIKKLTEVMSGIETASINNKIEEIISEVRESYNYARYMQKTILPDDLYIRECFSDSFVLFKPKDIVSGDLYFFSRKKNTVYFAAGDCTGHGIPGAFLSVISYGITDETVNEKNIEELPVIIDNIYSRIHRFLRWDEDKTGLADDMDIAMCRYCFETKILSYSGVNIPLYRISGDELLEYKPEMMESGMQVNACNFSSKDILTKKGDIIYLFSDGFRDQFGGKDRKKYGSTRLKSFLLSIKDRTMPEQREFHNEEIERWRSELDEDQTDDILVIGIRL